MIASADTKTRRKSRRIELPSSERSEEARGGSETLEASRSLPKPAEDSQSLQIAPDRSGSLFIEIFR